MGRSGSAPPCRECPFAGRRAGRPARVVAEQVAPGDLDGIVVQGRQHDAAALATAKLLHQVAQWHTSPAVFARQAQRRGQGGGDVARWQPLQSLQVAGLRRDIACRLQSQHAAALGGGHTGAGWAHSGRHRLNGPSRATRAVSVWARRAARNRNNIVTTFTSHQRARARNGSRYGGWYGLTMPVKTGNPTAVPRKIAVRWVVLTIVDGICRWVGDQRSVVGATGWWRPSLHSCRSGPATPFRCRPGAG